MCLILPFVQAIKATERPVGREREPGICPAVNGC